MSEQKTLVLIKPYAVKIGWAGDVRRLYTDKFDVVELINGVSMTAGRAANFYREHRGQEDYASLLKGLTNGPMVAIILTGEDVVKKVRHFTDQSESNRTIERGLVHCSQSPEAAEREINLIFE